MSPLGSFFSSFLSYLILVVIIVVIAGVAVFIGTSLAKYKNRKQESYVPEIQENTVKDESGNV